ncbi:MAG: EAL domain-containing protein [Vicinamibacteria bacterium]|nr:EAL domain-containing protein [Vicinamibacteria bacterium]
MVDVPSITGVQSRIGSMLREQGGLGAIVIDLVSLIEIERRFGTEAYLTVRQHIQPLLDDLRGRLRDEDVLAVDAREGDRFVFFLSAARSPRGNLAMKDLKGLARRMEDSLQPKVFRVAHPYGRERPAVDVGYAFVLYSPLASEERQIAQLIEEARRTAELSRVLRERQERERLLQIIFNRTLWTAFQPIVEIESRRVMGHEALSRGPRASELEPPLVLFDAASRHGLVAELERACRRRIFQDWADFGAPGRLFLNTVPSTIRDPSFRGRGMIDMLGESLSPRLITLEITEREVIENIGLYREAMHSFLEMGFSFAIDDLGAGYSGLETLVTLGASYLKIDMGLVRDVHLKRINQQVVRAIAEMGAAVGATVIAEGIQTGEEAETLFDLGVHYGQGYFFGRPIEADVSS